MKSDQNAGTGDIAQANAADAGALLNLSTLANWNQLEQDWLRLLKFHPEGCLRLRVSGGIVASSTIMPYMDSGAWLGMVLVHPESRGKGYGKAIVSAALNTAKKLGFSWVGLDATEAGRIVYNKLGFTDCFPVRRWRRAGNGKCGGRQSKDLSGGIQLSHDPNDLIASPADRRWIEHLLQENATSLLVHSGSHALLRPGREAWHLGPVLSGNQDGFRRLLQGACALCGEDQIYLDCFSHPLLDSALEPEGFAPVRHLTRMVLGREALPEPAAPWEIYKGFEWG